MTGVIWETPERRGCLWRLEVARHKGRTFVNWRMWWRNADGVLKPSRQGVTFPPERLLELLAAVLAWRDANALSGPENGS